VKPSPARHAFADSRWRYETTFNVTVAVKATVRPRPQDVEINQQWERSAENAALLRMQLIDAPECLARARYCRELAMSTADSMTKQSLLQMANDFQAEAQRLGCDAEDSRQLRRSQDIQ
jgi:hypothetical protein